MPATTVKRDYSLVGPEGAKAEARGLVSATWYHTDVARKDMKALMQRRDGPAIRDTILWFALLAAFGAGGAYFWGSWWALPFFLCYGPLYGSASDSRWHECGHGTAFKTQWMNVAVYYIASFMIYREPTIWRWSHARHHTDTIIIGRDREIHATRPPNFVPVLLNLFALKNTLDTTGCMIRHALGRMSEEDKTYVPETEWEKVILEARVFLAIHLAIILAAVAVQSLLPMMLVGVLPSMYGAWLGVYVGYTQHAGLAEDILDHRMNSRTVYMNPIFRFTYWNMNYHVEHHMFPLVPYHQLPRLHEMVRHDTPPPYRSTFEAYGEIIPTLLRQRREPGWFVRRPLPPTARPWVPGAPDPLVAAAAGR
jgi:fatty acid desaturase